MQPRLFRNKVGASALALASTVIPVVAQGTLPADASTMRTPGPDAEQFYRAVLQQVQTTGRGQLSISVERDHAVIGPSSGFIGWAGAL